jgi:hypothetical protein
MGVNYVSVRWLARELGGVPKELRRELRPRIRLAGQELVGDLKASSAGFSQSIPPAVRMTVSFASKTGGVRIFVDRKKAPAARPLEHAGAAGTFRHPVFGNRDVWVAQQAHPFFFRTVSKHRDRVRSLVEDAVRASFPRGSM